MMKQFAQIKAQYPDCILFYRVGDFYETFGEDALVTSKVLGLVLTRKPVGGGAYTELAGVPHHAIDSYLPKLVEAGYKVAVCDQLEDPKLTKKIVKRGVTELVTPGVSFNDSLLKESENNFLCACFFEGDKGGVAFLDVSTGTFKVAEGNMDYIEVLLNDFSPKEVLLSKGYKEGFISRFGTGFYITALDEWAFSRSAGEKKLLTHFGLETLSGFGISGMSMGIAAAAAILFYMDLTEHKNIDHIKSISRVDRDDFVWIDRFTFRNLEVFNSLAGAQGVSLIQSIDKTSSPLGARKLREWLAMPLKNPDDIKARHDLVQAVFDSEELCESLRGQISNIGDLERIVSKAAAGRIAPREVLQLSRGLKSISKIIAEGESVPAIRRITSCLDGLEELVSTIEKTILADAAAQIG
ncbi:MAG: DNA mismatch repair protein MutS, partial [Bacteroidales bacterium]|nr:DNA mismatch repair protein MutS [Bacteroidales bacterium]